MNVELLMEIIRPVTLLAPHTEEEEEDDPAAKLQAYAPMYATLIEPP